MDGFHISIEVPRAIQAKARYALQQLSFILGIRFHLVTHEFPQPDAVYGDAIQNSADCVWLPFDPRAYSGATDYSCHSVDGATVWGPTHATAQAWDLVGATFRLLAFLDESQVPEENRDAKGIFKVGSLPAERRRCLTELLVENHAAELRRRLAPKEHVSARLTVPLWPRGKKWAFLLSHDTDAITLGSPLEMFVNLAKWVMRRDGASLTMFKDGFSYLHRPSENPLFGFPGWRKLEEPAFRSCFYLFVRPRSLKRHLNDCRSTVVEQNIDWRILRDMADAGWEFGLHAPIHAKDHLLALSWAKQFIEEKLNKPVFGLRHHYWALDWRRPHLTFQKHIDAGFRYDASVAWRDNEGFRAGTCFPFQPFDPDAQAAMPLYEIPTCLMDGHVVDKSHSSRENPAERVTKLLHEIRTRNGVAFLNWHTETACNAYRYRGYADVLSDVLRFVSCDSEAWITTPYELIKWWSTRQQHLSQC